MGMDVFGKNPTSERGEYFRASVWGWRPIAWFLENEYPEYAGKIEYLHSNDGAGLGADDARALGERMLAERNHLAIACQEFNAVRDALPDQPCRWCHGTGTRTDSIGVEMGMDKKGWCNGCEGKGAVRPFEASYSADIDFLMEFARFMKDSGGFEIW